MRFNYERVRYKLPEVFYLHIHEVVFLPEALHYLISAVVARGNQELGPRVLDLLGFDSTVKDSFFHVRSRPGTTACTATEIISTVGIHFNIVFTTLLRYPPGFLVITVAEHTLTLAAVVARVMIGGQVLMDRLIELDSPFFDVLLQQVKNAQELNVFVGIPFLQTKPGRIVGVPSLG
jgi:hypothetical protein